MRFSISHFLFATLFAVSAFAQEERPEPRPDGPPPRDANGPRGPGGRGGPGGGGGPNREDVALVEKFDENEDGWLNAEERVEARKELKKTVTEGGERPRGGRGGGPGGPSGGGGRRGKTFPEASAGPKVSPEEVKSFPEASLYDLDVVRTLFLTFDNEEWESELADFKFSDVEIPAKLVVDGKTYPGVGVSFRGASSFFSIPAGHKRSFNLSLDLINEEQRLYGCKNLNLLNGNGDASMMSTVLYSQLANAHLPTPKANFVKVVVNGEYWGVYANVQQFDKRFIKDNFESSKGTRWKVPGSPRGDGGLAYDGDEMAPYEERYDMKSNDGEEAWKALIELCRVLNETPLEKLEEELKPILAIDEALWFLAYDIVLGNSDGYWTRASDYNIFRDEKGVFHIIPHDMNEAFRLSPGRGGNGEQLDPLRGLDEERKPLRSRLLQVPALQKRYLGFVEEIAEKELHWDNLGKMVAHHRELIAEDLKKDTRKLSSYEDFKKATGAEGLLQNFAQQRREFLLKE